VFIIVVFPSGNEYVMWSNEQNEDEEEEEEEKKNRENF
jgi:hypothetical protein